MNQMKGMNVKIINFSDLHISWRDCIDLKEKKKWIAETCWLEKPDIVILSGDIVESMDYIRNKQFNCYRRIAELFDGYKVLCVTGNHEYCGMRVNDVLDYYGQTYKPEKFDVHYLDVIGHVDIGGYRFVGNCLWYDGSTKTVGRQDLYEWANLSWIDRTIKEFDCEKENAKCVEQIKSNLSSEGNNILVTHCIPHIELNGHIDFNLGVGMNSLYNAYSGMKNLFEMIPSGIVLSFSGHTHRRVVKELCGVKCYNSGNDYIGSFKYCMAEV